MAIYEYRCKKCDKSFDLMRRLAQRDDPAVCPLCRSRRTVHNTILAFAVKSGASPDIGAGVGDFADFGGGDDDHGLDMGGDDFDF